MPNPTISARAPHRNVRNVDLDAWDQMRAIIRGDRAKVPRTYTRFLGDAIRAWVTANATQRAVVPPPVDPRLGRIDVANVDVPTWGAMREVALRHSLSVGQAISESIRAWVAAQAAQDVAPPAVAAGRA